MKSLYDLEHEWFNKDLNPVWDKVSDSVKSLFNDLMDDGYPIRQIAELILDEVQAVKCERLLIKGIEYRRAKRKKEKEEKNEK